MSYVCKFCNHDIVPGQGTRDFCSTDCKTAFVNLAHVARQRRYNERQMKLEKIYSSSYAKILAANSVRTGSTRNFRVWVYENISETMSAEDIKEIIEKLTK